MRLLLVAAALVLSACAPRAATNCNLEATHDFALSGASETDTITAQTIGPSCDKAIGLYVVRDADGYALWSWSAPLRHAFGDVFARGVVDFLRTNRIGDVLGQIDEHRPRPAGRRDQERFIDHARQLPHVFHEVIPFREIGRAHV